MKSTLLILLILWEGLRASWDVFCGIGQLGPDDLPRNDCDFQNHGHE